MTDATIRAFCAEQRELLELELQSEREETAAAASVSSFEDASRSHVLHQLQAADVSVGLYGRTVVRLEAVSQGLLPAHRFTTGDEVEIRSKSDRKSHPGGVVNEVTEESISIALFPASTKGQRGRSSQQRSTNDNDEDDNLLGTPPYSLLPKSSIEVHKKLMAALDELEKRGTDHPVAGPVVRALFELPTNEETNSPPPNDSFTPFNNQLDESQIQAITFALASSRPVALLHGPPGSGKTTAVSELIQQAVHRYGYSKILVTAPSNVAVDNVLARLVAPTTSTKRATQSRRLQVVRLGHPARLQVDILPYSLEALVHRAEETEIVADVRRELQSLMRRRNRREHRELIRSLRAEIKSREEKVVQSLLQNAQVILATCVGAASKLIKDMEFDLVVIDEAAQSLEAACWIPALLGKKLVLAGDHCQLPPTIKSHQSRVLEGLGRTLFERLMQLYGDNGPVGRISRMLQVQYRMNERIAGWASQALYGGALKTHESVSDRTLAQLDSFIKTDQEEDDGISETPLLLIDTAGCEMYESTNAAGSRFNEGEAELVRQHVQRLLNMGVQQKQIAIITPYNGQVEVLRNILLPEAPKLEIRSVDGFQGGEREAVVLSLVRSSERGGMSGIGFLRDDRRLNVAVTRAKRHCCVISDSETVSQSRFVQNLISWIGEHGEHRSALEYVSPDTNEGQLESDLRHAQIEMEKLLNKDSKPASTNGGRKTEKQKVKQIDVEANRTALLEKIRLFSEMGSPGAEMPLSTELSKADRKAVHELAEELGLGHLSTGIEGVDRRITVSIPLSESSTEQPSRTDVSSLPATETVAPKDDESSEQDVEEGSKCPAASFSALTVDGDQSDDGEEVTEDAQEAREDAPVVFTSMSTVLGDLAKERAQREKLRKQDVTDASKKVTKQKGKGSKSKKKGQKLGGTKLKAQGGNDNDGANEDEMDDMAFLDAQINKVQNSHGRTISGTGSNYRTIVSGVLLSRPNQTETKKDTRASAALQSKIKQAANDRRGKPKKKK